MNKPLITALATTTIALAGSLSACGSSANASGSGNDDGSDTVYHSVAEFGRASYKALGSDLGCNGVWKTYAQDDGIYMLADAEGSCGDTTPGGTGCIVTLYSGEDAMKQGLEGLKDANPNEPMFYGKNWVAFGGNIAGLKGKMPGTLDKNGGSINIEG